MVLNLIQIMVLIFILYAITNSNIAKGTFFIKEGVKFKHQTEPRYILCYRNNKEKCDKDIKVISDDMIKTPEFDILKMTLYIPKGYKMPTGEDVIYVNINKVKK